jgi:hypothetical protein
VTEVRFHREIYRGTAIDEAVKVLAAYATFELIEEREHWVVRVSADNGKRERRVCGELGNYALGLTVRAR